MAIGGNHFIQACRRNADLNIVIFNNKIYGMTKGQSSPTTPVGLRTKTAPEGSYENPFNIGEVAIGSGATFFARVPDNNPKLMEDVMMQAYQHQGTSVIEVLQNCVIFTDGIHEQITGRDTKDDNQLLLQHGEPMIFGKEKNFGLEADGMRLKKSAIKNKGKKPLVHDEANPDTAMHLALTRMQIPDYPVAMGVIRKVETENYSKNVHETIAYAKEKSSFKSVDELFRSGNTWEIE